MKMRSLLLAFIIPALFLGACQRSNQQKPVHHESKVVKKVVYVHRKSHHKTNQKPKPVPPIANLKHHYRVLNEPVITLTFHSKPNESIGMQMNEYLNSVVNLSQYHMQVSSTNNATYVTLKQI